MQKTPLYDIHVKLGARIVEFGGWLMPVQYSSLSEEHHAVRTKAGIFDVSHMGEFLVEGPGAEAFLNNLVTNDVTKLTDGKALYTVMCQEDGGIIDDLLIYRRAAQKYLLCVNASNIEKDFNWVTKHKTNNITLKNASSEYCQIALQGPLSEKILKKLTSYNLSQIEYYHFAESTVANIPCIISRTGYTGEDGFEIYAAANTATKLWTAIFEAGSVDGLRPCGLGARDTLRTEMAYTLYGHEIDLTTNPIEAGLGWIVKLQKENFIGKPALQKVKEAGPTRKLMGIRMHDKGIPRQGYDVYAEDSVTKIGQVTSGTLSPSLAYPIAIAYISAHYTTSNKVLVKIRDRMWSGEIVKMPFYSRK